MASMLVAGMLIGVVLALSGGDDKDVDRGRTPVTTPPRERPVPRDLGRAVRLQPVGGAKAGGGTARLVGRDRVRLSVEGLPDASPGSYEVWLYDSVADAVPLGRLAPGAEAIEARLPANPGDYRYLDISREPRDGNRAHSGVSVLRVSISRLAR